MSEFVTFLHEVFESFGTIKSRKMFGGHGIYHQDLMFGLVADDELYLKTDDDNIAEFLEQGLQAFEFKTKDGKVMQMSYLKAPEDIYDDPDQARYWADLSFAAALRNSAKNNRKKSRKKKTKKKL
jgi:DNA transformation protein